MQTRNNELSAVIRAALAIALDPDDAHSVWAVVVTMAEQEAKPPPLLGYCSTGVQYMGREYREQGLPDSLTFKMFSDRLRRYRSSAR